MDKKPFLLLFLLFFTSFIFAQQVSDPIVFKINGKPVLKSEVARAYHKVNVENKEKITDFIQSYINFKLNVEEAKAQHLDTVASYRREYSAYRLQMARPYLRDTVYESQYVEKIYNRLLENIEVNHVLIPFENQNIVLPSDTAVAYKKAIDTRADILKKGFENIEFNTPRAKTLFVPHAEFRNGYLGWVTSFMLSPEVEDVVYTLPLLDVSTPIRTAKGYHIVQVLNKRPAVGAVEIEQVVFSFPRIPPTQHQIDSVGKFARQEYQNIHSSVDFQSLCDEFGRAHQTGDKGCYFGVIGLDSNYPLDFTAAAFNLQNPGDISQPVMSDYGFHIIRLLNKISVPTLESMRDQIKERITKGDRIKNLSIEKRNRLKNEFQITINNDAYAKLDGIAVSVSPKDSLFSSMIRNGDDILLDIEGQRAYSVSEFAKYIRFRQMTSQSNIDEPEIFRFEEASLFSLSTDILKEYFDNFLNILLSDYADYTLEKRFPDFRLVMDEFSEELLVYEVKNRNIWERSKTDEAGLANYFSKNKKIYLLDGTKYKGMVVYAKDNEALKAVETLISKEKSQEQLIEDVKNTLNKDSLVVKIEPGLWSKGDNPYIDNKVFSAAEPSPYKGYPYFAVIGEFINKPEDYKDVKNAVEADYQQVLDEKWNLYLKDKYKVEIDKSILKTIK